MKKINMTKITEDYESIGFLSSDLIIKSLKLAANELPLVVSYMLKNSEEQFMTLEKSLEILTGDMINTGAVCHHAAKRLEQLQHSFGDIIEMKNEDTK